MDMKEFKQLCNEAYADYRKLQGYKEEMKEIQISLDQKNSKIIEEMSSNEQTQFAGDGFKAIKVCRMSVKMPKTNEEKKELMEHLEKEGLLTDYFTVNHAKLNKYYNESLEHAIDEHNVEFKIPGIEAPSSYEYISFRKNN